MANPHKDPFFGSPVLQPLTSQPVRLISAAWVGRRRGNARTRARSAILFRPKHDPEAGHVVGSYLEGAGAPPCQGEGRGFKSLLPLQTLLKWPFWARIVGL